MELAMQEYKGRKYRIIGRLKGCTSEPGTVVGPNTAGEYGVVIGYGKQTYTMDDEVIDAYDFALIARAQIQDMAAIKTPDDDGNYPDPRSVTEYKLQRRP